MKKIKLMARALVSHGAKVAAVRFMFALVMAASRKSASVSLEWQRSSMIQEQQSHSLLAIVA
jgi:hypothetical protein